MNIADKKIEVINWNKKMEAEACALLNKYKATSFFLLSNLQTYGAKLTDGTYSANFKCLIKNGRVVGVFALTKIGNLIMQTDRTADYTKIIVDECLKENIALKGVVGIWELAEHIWNYALEQLPALKETRHEKEILFQLMLDQLSLRQCKHEVRYLKSNDYSVWDQLNKSFMREHNLDPHEDETARYKRFLDYIKNGYWYGLFIDNCLMAIASGVSNIEDLVWLGGVYTLPEMRKQGLATELVYKILWDCKINKHKSRAILFTGEDNFTAIKVYEKLGFQRIGYFGLFFGKYEQY